LRVVVTVDPSGTKGKDDSGDWIGIVVVGPAAPCSERGNFAPESN